MSTDLSITLSRLRDIGWKEWDPIGLLTAGEAWDQKPFADEYDDYLRKVVAGFRNGRPLAEAVEYLLRIEREHMALGIRLGQEARAEATARAIQRSVVPSA
ncbi:hypothetical protein U8607_04300 [Methylobacterium durans]|uniref:hypothetical protein n=1 Tax=Methylobacterium durans TaxID=2202825 RepID=UPI002AFE0376|nr:hypothetical protein [Methylobacterium durans]MEA1831298.1 hypothetical protein [Methylobacterium durans]